MDERVVLNLEGTLVPEHVQTCCMCVCVVRVCVSMDTYRYSPISLDHWGNFRVEIFRVTIIHVEKISRTAVIEANSFTNMPTQLL